jgi:hypothetical protein
VTLQRIQRSYPQDSAAPSRNIIFATASGMYQTRSADGVTGLALGTEPARAPEKHVLLTLLA